MCQICGRKWLTPSMLRYHIHNQHNTERVRCPKCPMGFAKALEMREHLRCVCVCICVCVHVCVRAHVCEPYVCPRPICCREAIDAPCCRTHTNLPHICFICGDGFLSGKDALAHRDIQHADKLRNRCLWRATNSWVTVNKGTQNWKPTNEVGVKKL